jgi:hypothetical protein
MPIYLYKNPKTNEIKEIFQRMAEEHVYQVDGIPWKRVFEAPQASTGQTIGNLDPFNKQAFIEKTGNLRNVTQGDMWDLSADLSSKREKTLGKDPVKEKVEKSYEHRTGKPHPFSIAKKTTF